MTEAQFVNELQLLGIQITDEQLLQLSEYYNLLISWNEKINLTGITDKETVYLKHFYDSISIVKVIDLTSISSLCDVGTGAGFPGLVLKIIFPHLKITLVDSLQKRMNFLNEVITTLKLHEIEIITSRAEEYALITREKYDVVTARAVANLNILLEYCVPLVKVNGYFIPLKGNATEEVAKATNAINKLSLTIEMINKFKLPKEESDRTIIKFKKEKSTDLKYPRQYKDMLKKPL